MDMKREELVSNLILRREIAGKQRIDNFRDVEDKIFAFAFVKN